MENYLKQFAQSRADKKKNQKEQEVAEMFDIEVKNGKLWITHNGYAIKEISDEMTAKEIADEIENYRSTAQRFGTELAKTYIR